MLSYTGKLRAVVYTPPKLNTKTGEMNPPRWKVQLEGQNGELVELVDLNFKSEPKMIKPDQVGKTVQVPVRRWTLADGKQGLSPVE